MIDDCANALKPGSQRRVKIGQPGQMPDDLWEVKFPRRAPTGPGAAAVRFAIGWLTAIKCPLHGMGAPLRKRQGEISTAQLLFLS